MPLSRFRFRLLPRNLEIGWAPFGWLIWLLIFLVPLFAFPYSTAYRAVALAATALFLTLYFVGFWVEPRTLLKVSIAIAAIGAAFIPTHSGASVFFVYAASFFGEALSPKRALRALAILVGFIGAQAWWVQLPPDAWIPAVLISLVIGGTNIHFAQMRRRGARLKLAQEEVEQLAKLDERERIARDLHDVLGHTLSVITLKSELAARLALSEPGRAEREMREVERLSREAMSEVRRTVRGYRFQQLGTELAKARVALEAAAVVAVVETSPYALRPDEESVLALALREAVTNVVRHAEADRCRIQIRTDTGGELTLEVADNGCGLKPTGHRNFASHGHGLTGMRERIEAIGGQLEIENSTASRRKGTTVRVTLPPRATRPGTDLADMDRREAVH